MTTIPRPQADYRKEMALAKDLAREAGATILKYFGSKELGVRLKGDRTAVTVADREINDFVIESLSHQTPGYSVWGEERSQLIEGSAYTWVCDPIDGTSPFIKGIPIATFSLALVDDSGQSVLGVIYDPFQDRLYQAIRGQGAYLNGEKIVVSSKQGLEGAYIDEELWINQKKGISFDSPRDSLNKLGAKVTTLDAAVVAGAMVASGDYEALIFGQDKPEDIAALSVIVTEAGGQVTDLFGQKQRYDTKIGGAIVSNGRVHEELVRVVADIGYRSRDVLG